MIKGELVLRSHTNPLSFSGWAGGGGGGGMGNTISPLNFDQKYKMLLFFYVKILIFLAIKVIRDPRLTQVSGHSPPLPKILYTPNL